MIDQKLLTLLAVDECKSFSKAGKVLGLTQPAVSNHIKELEKEFNVKLFIRTFDGLKTTNEGKIAIQYAKRIKSIYGQFNSAINNALKNILMVNIGVTHTAESSFVIEALAKYANEKAGLRITFITDTIKKLYDHLSDYSIDLAILEGHNYDKRFSSLLLDTDSLLLAVSPDNKLSALTSVTLDQVRKEKMIVRGPNSGTRQLFESSLAGLGLSLDDFDVNIQSDSIATIKDLVKKNVGVSVLAKSTCLNEEKKNRICLIPIEGLPMIREVNLVYSPDYENKEVLIDIVKAYKAEAKKMILV
ncbi:MAG: LysR family transcriptional regulator [Bacilli bacterium]